MNKVTRPIANLFLWVGCLVYGA